MSGHATDAAIGMMDGAYFTSRNDILSFLNTLLDLNLVKIEQTASGYVLCKLLFDSLYTCLHFSYYNKTHHSLIKSIELWPAK
jgi:RP/EB family microtubule-associated protein